MYILVNATLAYMLGVTLASGIFGKLILWGITLFVCFCIAHLIYKKNIKLVTLAVMLVFLCLGAANMRSSRQKFDFMKHYSNRKVTVCGRVVDVNGSTLRLKLRSIDNINVNHTIELSFYEFADPALSDSELTNNELTALMQAKYAYGDVISAVVSLNTPQRAQYRGDFDREIYSRARGISATCLSNETYVTRMGNETLYLSPWRIGYLVRNNIRNTINELLPSDEAELLRGIMLGDRLEVLRESVRRSGIAHLVAVSGFHVSIILLGFCCVIRQFFPRNYVISACGIIVLFLFYTIIGYNPSIFRAVLMSAMVLSACFFCRKAELYTTVAFSALMALIAKPYALFDVSFLMSFAAALMLIRFVRPLSSVVNNYLLNLAIISAIASAGTVVITAWYFNTVTLGGVISNIAIVPLTVFVLPAGYIMCALAAVWTPLGRVLSYTIYLPLYLIKNLALFFAGIPYFTIDVPTPTWEFVIVYLALIYVFAWKGVPNVKKT